MDEKEKTMVASPTADTTIRDRLDFVYWSVYYVGLVVLLPWNILITVSGYWDYKFRNVSADYAEVRK